MSGRGRAALAAWAASVAALAAALLLAGCSEIDLDAYRAEVAEIEAERDESLARTQAGSRRFVFFGTDDGGAALGTSAGTYVLRDRETGVQYLVAYFSRMGGIGVTPLLNADGTPSLDPEAGE